MIHKSVLLHKSIDGLAIKDGDIFVDGTLGNGGHTEEVCRRFGNKVRIIGIDLDSEAISRSKERLNKQNFQVEYLEGNFRDMDKLLASIGITKVDKIILDIGLSSNQFEESGRGFTFQKDEPLIMSFKKEETENDLTAREIVNCWDEENIATILKGYGEEKYANKIAKAIVEFRKNKKIETTFELRDIILSATPKFYHHRKIHPATKTFQALRITVNNELENLKRGMEKSFEILNTKGRLAIISFHSLEDRKVKEFFRQKEDEGRGLRINKKIITADDEELEENPRSRSAKLRIIEKN